MTGKFLEKYKSPLLIVDLAALVSLSVFMRSQLNKSGIGPALLALTAFALFVFFLFVFAKIVSPVLSGYLAENIARNIVLPHISAEACMPEHSGIQAKITRGELDSAIADLKKALLENPSDEKAVELMCEILADHKKDYMHALGLLVGHLRKELRKDSDLLFVMRLADIYLDCGFDDKARSLMQAEIERKGYTEKARQTIGRRLEGLRGT
ncbi:MAG: hypothetical protein JW808_02925 [Victivallales bacterium]|nr:hypothetical protein [Victivallales bacterium]